MAADARGAFWAYLRKLLPPNGHYSRIESEQAPGFPDVAYTLDGVSGTIELKVAQRPGAKYPFSGANGLRKSQLRWIEEECAAGGHVLLALQVGNRVYLLDADPYACDLRNRTLEHIEYIADQRWTKGRGGKPPTAAVLARVLCEW